FRTKGPAPWLTTLTPRKGGPRGPSPTWRKGYLRRGSYVAGAFPVRSTHHCIFKSDVLQEPNTPTADPKSVRENRASSGGFACTGRKQRSPRPQRLRSRSDRSGGRRNSP